MSWQSFIIPYYCHVSIFDYSIWPFNGFVPVFSATIRPGFFHYVQFSNLHIYIDVMLIVRHFATLIYYKQPYSTVTSLWYTKSALVLICFFYFFAFSYIVLFVQSGQCGLHSKYEIHGRVSMCSVSLCIIQSVCPHLPTSPDTVLQCDIHDRA